MTTAAVHLWGTRIGAVSWDASQRLGFFEFDPGFRDSGIEVAPLMMPLGPRVYSFPALGRNAFHGLPGMLADALPDRFGNAVIDAWLLARGRAPDDFDPVERLCYTGRRGMGALEFEPAIDPGDGSSAPLDVAALADLASAVLGDREGFVATLTERGDTGAVRDILRVGTSAGGARAKAVIAWNPETGEVRSGQVDVDEGFSHWLLKFDGVTANRDRELRDPLGYCRVEFAYSKMARAAGIEMSECRLLEEGGRAHFVTRRFDRTDDGSKLHLQSLAAIGHFDFDLPGSVSYEQTLHVMRRLGLPMRDLEQQFRRMVFNIVARNQDDHVKNIAFLMRKDGAWRLSPAFDVTYAYNPQGAWTGRHQMTVNGKRDDFVLDDLDACAAAASLRRGIAPRVFGEVREAVAAWPTFAAEAGVEESWVDRIAAAHRLALD